MNFHSFLTEMCDVNCILKLFQIAILTAFFVFPFYYHGYNEKVGVYVGFVIIENIAAFLVFGLDKKRAIEGKWRISECTLHMCYTLFGAVGAFMGMKCFNHKTSKGVFICDSVCMACACAAVYTLLWFYMFGL